MDELPPPRVGKHRFVGRIEDQKQFRAALSEVLRQPAGEQLPYVFLLYGDGGMGKSSLAQRFCAIALYEQPFEGEFATFAIDWGWEQRKHASLREGREYVSPETVFEVIYEQATHRGAATSRPTSGCARSASRWPSRR